MAPKQSRYEATDRVRVVGTSMFVGQTGTVSHEIKSTREYIVVLDSGIQTIVTFIQLEPE